MHIYTKMITGYIAYIDGRTQAQGWMGPASSLERVPKGGPGIAALLAGGAVRITPDVDIIEVVGPPDRLFYTKSSNNAIGTYYEAVHFNIFGYVGHTYAGTDPREVTYTPEFESIYWAWCEHYCNAFPNFLDFLDRLGI